MWVIFLWRSWNMKMWKWFRGARTSRTHDGCAVYCLFESHVNVWTLSERNASFVALKPSLHFSEQDWPTLSVTASAGHPPTSLGSKLLSYTYLLLVLCYAILTWIFLRHFFFRFFLVWESLSRNVRLTLFNRARDCSGNTGWTVSIRCVWTVHFVKKRIFRYVVWASNVATSRCC